MKDKLNYLKIFKWSLKNVFSPDKTVYEMDSGSYFDWYSSFKQTRAPVLLMYWEFKQQNHYLNANMDFWYALCFASSTELKWKLLRKWILDNTFPHRPWAWLVL